MSDDILSDSQQENILNILIQDDLHYKLVLPYLEPVYFNSIYYRKIFDKTRHYINRFKKTPGKHVYDILESEIGENKDYEDILRGIFKNEINTDYVINNITDFARQQKLKIGILKAAEFIESGRIQDVEEQLSKLRKTETNFFDKGSHVDLSFLDQENRDSFPVGIPPLDNVDACPARKELYAFIGLPNKGKSQFLVHLGKIGMMTRRKVLHITLEMSEAKVKQRYIQSFFNVTKRRGEQLLSELEVDEYGCLVNYTKKKFKAPFNFYDTKDIENVLNKKLERLPIENLIIKEFPSGHLDMTGLTNYVDMLIDYENFHPDMILLDYPRKMKLGAKYLREELGNYYIQLRGFASEYNLAMVVVAQINREAKREKVPWIDESYLQEDFSLTNEADFIVSYNQTAYEYEENLARLYLTKSRSDVRDLKVLISQNYHCCQFAIESALLRSGIYKIKQGD